MIEPFTFSTYNSVYVSYEYHNHCCDDSYINVAAHDIDFHPYNQHFMVSISLFCTFISDRKKLSLSVINVIII